MSIDFHNKHKQFIKFILVGGLNTLFGYSILALLTLLNFHYAITTFIATVLGILFNFKTTGYIVFKKNNNKLIFKFLLAYGIIYLLSLGFIKTFIFFGFDNLYCIYALLLIPNALLSFFLMKKFVFT